LFEAYKIIWTRRRDKVISPVSEESIMESIKLIIHILTKKNGVPPSSLIKVLIPIVNKYREGKMKEKS